MIDVEDTNAVSYYHYDGLGSVVALSDEDGDTIQVYEYDVYGNVAASDPNHTNPFMFTGRRMDRETGLYFYRARYYNPAIGRFLQTDPMGYSDGMNVYAYGGNNPVNTTDPSGLIRCTSDILTGYLYWPETGVWEGLTGTWNINGLSEICRTLPQSFLMARAANGLAAYTYVYAPGWARHNLDAGGFCELDSRPRFKGGRPNWVPAMGFATDTGYHDPPDRVAYPGRRPPAFGGRPGYDDGWPDGDYGNRPPRGEGFSSEHCRKIEQEIIDDVVEKYNMNKWQRRRVHDKIRGYRLPGQRCLSREEIDQLAREVMGLK